MVWFHCQRFAGLELRAHPGRDFGGRNSSLLEAKAMLLMNDIVRQLSHDNIHSGSSQ